ncbi:MAG: type IX secretion system membrane protein PorP/SprF [Bacteroidota bacterium]
MNKKLAVAVLAWGLSAAAVAQQDGQYSQYMFNQLSINPAYAGSREVLAVSTLYRKQWIHIDGAPQTSTFTVQVPLRNKKVGLGFETFSDRLGPRQVDAALFSYAYRIPLLNGNLAMGLRFGGYSYQIFWNKIKYRDQNDPYNHYTVEKKGVLTADFGLYYYSKSFYWGFSATHLNRAELISPDTLPAGRLVPHLYSPIGMGFQLSSGLVINPSLLVKVVKGAPVDVDVNCNFLFNEKLWLGLSYRLSYGVVALMQWNITDHLKLGYGYDLGLNRIGTVGGATHELMLGYDFSLKNPKTISPRYL